MAAPLGRQGTLLPWCSVAEAPLLRAPEAAVSYASTEAGGARVARLTYLTTGLRLSPPPPLTEKNHEEKDGDRTSMRRSL